MKKVVTWGLVISYIALCIAICVIGIKIFDGNYDIVAEGCVALIFLLISCVCNIYRAFSNRCPPVSYTHLSAVFRFALLIACAGQFLAQSPQPVQRLSALGTRPAPPAFL